MMAVNFFCDRANLVASDPQLRSKVLGALQGLGYRNALLEESYAFTDWFTSTRTKRTVNAVGFAATPISQDTACIGFVEANGVAGPELLDGYRALGAPVILESDGGRIREWMVSRESGQHRLIGEHDSRNVLDIFHARAQDWQPEELYRAKSIGRFSWAPEYTLFSGLLPELEEQIQQQLDPLLRSALSSVERCYLEETGRDASPSKMFRLVFWLLTAKVFHDREVKGFRRFGDSPDADALLEAVAKQYKSNEKLPLTKRCRDQAASEIWTTLDFRNISVDVLSQIWASTLVTKATKKTLGIHRTPKALVDYIVDRIPFKQNSTNDPLLVLEPCSGSGSFLVGAMHALRPNLFGHTPKQRHDYFTRTLAGIERDPFGAEISRLALTLADFPNPDGWNIREADVFNDPLLPEQLSKAAVVLCNPPFRSFSKSEKEALSAPFIQRPASLISLILDSLHPDGVLGFVLPRKFIDGDGGYASVRELIAKRFSQIEITALPDRAFPGASVETCLLIATKPITLGPTRLTISKVDDSPIAWEQFELSHQTSSSYTKNVSHEEMHAGIQMPGLVHLWDYLSDNPTLNESATLHRGIQWKLKLTSSGEETGNRNKLVSDVPRRGFSLGVEPKAELSQFQTPDLRYLDLRPESLSNKAYKYDWAQPKAIVNKSSKSRGPWRMSAFADQEGVCCYQTCIGIWPKDSRYSPMVISAIMNSPVANAFVVSWSGKTDITVKTMRKTPMPFFDESAFSRIDHAARDFASLSSRDDISVADLYKSLAQVDAAVLDAYQLPPRLESELLEYFSRVDRPVPFKFSEYEGATEDDAYFRLSERLESDFGESLVESALSRIDSGMVK